MLLEWTANNYGETSVDDSSNLGNSPSSITGEEVKTQPKKFTRLQYFLLVFRTNQLRYNRRQF